MNLESSSKAVVLYLPDSGEQILLDSYTSPRWAPFVKRPYTVDDRVFIVRHAVDSADQSYTEVDPDTLDVRLVAQASGRSDDERFAIAGDHVFYLTEPKSDPFRPTPSRQLKRMALSGSLPPEETVLNPSANALTRGTILADQGNVYWASQQDDELSLHQVDQPTGKLTPIGVFKVTGNADNLSWAFAVDDRSFYWAVLGGDRKVQVWRYDLQERTLPQVVGEVVVPSHLDPTLVTIDVDDGQMAMWLTPQPGDNSEIILFDTRSQETRMVDTGMKVFSVEIGRLGASDRR